jgi:hypothetical protein
MPPTAFDGRAEASEIKARRLVGEPLKTTWSTIICGNSHFLYVFVVHCMGFNWIQVFGYLIGF